MQTTSTRRALLAAAGALATLGAESAPAMAATSGDAELVRLGAEFDRVYSGWRAIWREWCRTENLWHDTVKARGLNFREHGEEAVFAVRDEVGTAVASAANDAVVNRLDAIAAQIRTHRPRTLAGLATFAKLARFDCLSPSILDQDPAARDWDDKCLVEFLALVESLAS